jgi:hypothetical protein
MQTMANISDVYDITFKASTEELAELLEQYIKIADKDAWYNLAGDVKREGKIVTGGYASGRWVYSNNLEGAFENPAQWLGQTAWKEAEPVFAQIKKLLEAGERIIFDYSEDEPGCGVFQDGAGNIEAHNGKIQVSIDFEEHPRPDCEWDANPDGTWHCQDQDHDQAEKTQYCEVAE